MSLLSLAGLAGVIYALGLRRIAGFPALAFGVSHVARTMFGMLLAGAILGVSILACVVCMA